MDLKSELKKKKRNALSSFPNRVSKEVQKLFFLDPDHYAL